MIFVLNKNKKPLNPCHPAKARWLLKNGFAVIHKRFPLTIRLRVLVDAKTQNYVLKFDPGAKTTGVAITEQDKPIPKVVFFAEIKHRVNIKSRLDSRRAFRKTRRSRKTRYRQPRFLNRTRKKGWLPPSIQSIVDNVESWTRRLKAICPISKISVETVRFDTQLLENPDINGVEYQHGTLFGYEVKEYLLYKYGHVCQYCRGESGDNVLENEHMVTKVNGGTNRIKNLTIACHTCNHDKNGMNLDTWFEFLKTHSKTKLNKARLKNIGEILKDNKPNFFKDAAKVNSSRKSVYRMLGKYTTNLEVSTGGRTKFNRDNLNLPKEHYYDALCVGDVPVEFEIPRCITVLEIKATGRGSYSRTNLDKYGFPRSYLPRTKMFFGYKTGDIVKAVVQKGKNQGIWCGRVAVRSRGDFNIALTDGTIKNGVLYKRLKILQKADGYNYNLKKLSKICIL